jgi:UDP-N-acetylglucosamine 1-carboxyvinyltransferase
MMGAVISDAQYGVITCEAAKLKGCDIQLDYPSVGATENVMLSAVYAEGDTVIHNAAREPEIVDLQTYLVKSGAKITGAGSEIIRIRGSGSVQKLGSVEHTVMPDRIVVGTYLTAAAAARGSICIDEAVPEHLSSILSVLRESGCDLDINGRSICLKAPTRPRAVDMMRTLPYPGFPTDMQAQMMAMLASARGTSMIVETVFENRFRHAEELMRMGADIRTQGRVAVVRGVRKLTGAEVCVWDLRGGAALIIAALAAEGRTSVFPGKYIERGYENIDKRLASLGADIVKTEGEMQEGINRREGAEWRKNPENCPAKDCQEDEHEETEEEA